MRSGTWAFPQCIWVSLQSYWKFLRTIVLISVVKVFIFSLFLSAFRQIFVSEHGWSWAGLAVQPWCPLFPCLRWCVPGRSLAVIHVRWAWTDDSACACQVLWRFCDNIPGVLGSLLAACICSCISKWFYCVSRAAGPFPSVWYCCLSVLLGLDCSVCTWQVFELAKAALEASFSYLAVFSISARVVVCWFGFFFSFLGYLVLSPSSLSR